MAEALTAHGVALDANGSPADMPREIANLVSAELIDVLVLLRAAIDAAGDTDLGGVGDGVLCCQSRAIALIQMANVRTRQVLKHIDPYA